MSERKAWDRREHETSLAYEAFRQYRDLGPSRRVDAMSNVSVVTCQRWSRRWDWVARATAWDDAQHMAEDAERLDALRTMHRIHSQAGRALMRAALEALRRADFDTFSATEIAALARLGAQLERETLTTSVDELQGKPSNLEDDPFDVIARELSGT
jgi:hypothetical protein